MLDLIAIEKYIWI